jgi:hypothetical protein
MMTTNVTCPDAGKGTTGGRHITRSAIAMTTLFVAEEVPEEAAIVAQEEATMVALSAPRTGATTVVAIAWRAGGMILRRITYSRNIHPTWGVLPRIKVTSLEALVAGALGRRTSSMETLV